MPDVIRRYTVTLSLPLDLAFTPGEPDAELTLDSEAFKRIVAENLPDWMGLDAYRIPAAHARDLARFIDRIELEREEDA
jgi:hypothetical protein